MNAATRPEGMIIEGIMTTLGEDADDGSMPERWNIAPMGPSVDGNFSRFILRPFKTATTYRNLSRTGQGVFHVTDDAMMIARSAVGGAVSLEAGAWRRADRVDGVVLTGACRYYELQVKKFDDREDRTTFEAGVVAAGTLREFLGFNRARHAVVEAAILATRVMLTGSEPILEQFAHFDRIVEKTGGPSEWQAMAELRQYVESSSRDAATEGA